MKTKEQANEMAAKLETELNRLPDRSFFGEDNTGDKEDLQDWAYILRKYARTGVVPDWEEYPDVYDWITSEDWSTLEDYE